GSPRPSYSGADDHFPGDRGTLSEPAKAGGRSYSTAPSSAARTSGLNSGDHVSRSARRPCDILYGYKAAGEAGDPGDRRTCASHGEGLSLPSGGTGNYSSNKWEWA